MSGYLRLVNIFGNSYWSFVVLSLRTFCLTHVLVGNFVGFGVMCSLYVLISTAPPHPASSLIYLLMIFSYSVSHRLTLQVVSFAVQRFLISCSLMCKHLGLSPVILESFSESSCLYLYPEVFSLLSSNSFQCFRFYIKVFHSV